jgi:HK97 family phage major capsid protein
MLPTHQRIGPLSGLIEFQKSPFVTKDVTRKSEHLMRAAYSLRSVLLQGQGLQGYELEVSESIKSESGIQSTGVAIPLSMFSRDLSVTSNGQLVETQVEKTLAENLQPYSVVARAGGTFIEGIKGNLTFPRIATTALPGWVPEQTAASGNSTTFSIASLAPKTLQSSITISRQLIAQSSPAVEELIMKQLKRSVGTSLDAAAFNGRGVTTFNEPLGILNWQENSTSAFDYNKRAAGVTFATTNAPTWSEVLALPYNVEASNVEPDTSCCFVTSPLGKNRLQKTQKATSFPIMIWGDDDTIGGKRAFATNNVNSNQLIYGKFESLLIAIWQISITSDPFIYASSGSVLVTIQCLADVAPLYGVAFAASSNGFS